MWVVALVVSLGLLAFTLAGSWRRAAWWLLALGQLVALFSPFFLCMVLPPVNVQAGVGLVALPLLALPARGPWCYRLACGLAFAAGWVTAGVEGVIAEREYARLRTVYPFEAMADRLPSRSPGTPPAFDEQEVTRSEGEFDLRSMTVNRPWGRTALLRRLHEEQVALFTDNAGFGVGRMGMFQQKPAVDSLDEDKPTQPSYEPSLGQMVRDDVLDFADPARWGYRRGTEVAGFLPHALRRQPGLPKEFAVESVELVGLLLAPDPRVYLSASLPRMDAVATTPTRHLDGFESPALARLRAGDELVHDEPLGRLLGAIRAAKQCLQCHGGDRGDLLGAFGYRLRPR